jgi:hypothetical protein
MVPSLSPFYARRGASSRCPPVQGIQTLANPSTLKKNKTKNKFQVIKDARRADTCPKVRGVSAEKIRVVPGGFRYSSDDLGASGEESGS